MRAALAVFRDELFAYRHLLAVAAAVSLLPLVATLVAPAGTSPTDLRALVALIGATAIGVLLAVALGTGLFARDLASGRIRYWLTRPVSVPALWLGRTGAALSCLYAALAIALLPAALMGDLFWIDSNSSTNLRSTSFSLLPLAGAVGLSFGLLFFLVQGLTLLERSRSRWLLLDLAGLATIGLVLSATLARLQQAGAWFASLRVIALLGFALLAGLAFGSLMALTRGRSDLVRSHRAFSLSLWSVLVLAAAALAGYARGFLAPEREELLIDRTYLFAPADADWFALSGQLAGRPGMNGLFLCEESRRGCRSLGFNYPWMFDGVTSSRDATHLAWFRFVDGELVRQVEAVGSIGTVGEPEARISLPLGTGRWVTMSQALSAGGRQLAQLDGERLTLFDTASGAAELTLAHPVDLARPRRSVRFADAGTLHEVGFEVAAGDSANLQRVELVAHAFDLGARSVREIGRIALPDSGSGLDFWISPSGRLVAVRTRSTDGPGGGSEPVFVLRLESGLSPLPAEALSTTSSLPAWLPDDRAIWTTHSAAGSRLHLLAPNGDSRAYDLPRTARFHPVALCGELLVASVSDRAFVRDGNRERLPATRSPEPRQSIADWRALAVDLSTGAVRELGNGLRALPWVGQDRTLGTRALFVGAGARVVELDPTTGAERVWLTATASSRE